MSKILHDRAWKRACVRYAALSFEEKERVDKIYDPERKKIAATPGDNFGKYAAALERAMDAVRDGNPAKISDWASEYDDVIAAQESMRET